MNQSKVYKNVVCGFGGQMIIMVIGLIIPRIMIVNYGSDVNGLMSTITQIFSYVALLEAGIGQAAKNALFRPITQGDRTGISFVLSVAKNYFRKVVLYYAAAVIILAFTAPVFLNSDVDAVTIFLIVILEGMSGVISFSFSATISIMLGADGRGYINNNISVINKIIGYIVKISMTYLGLNIVFVQLAAFLIAVAKAVFYKHYFHRYYGWVDDSIAPKTAKLNDRKAYIITEIAWTMFSSTDMIVISIFLNTKMSSVYGVYNIVFLGLNSILSAVYYNVNYLLGQAYHENLKKYEQMHDAFMTVFFGGMTVLVSVAYVLCIPFVQLYTRGISDIDYVYQGLPLMFSLVQLISWSRYVGGNLTGIAGYAKETSWISLVEACLNIGLSIILVQNYGLVGVLFATVIALPLKACWCVFVSDKKVLHRSYKKTCKIMGVNYLIFSVAVMVTGFVNISISNYGQFLCYGCVFGILFFLLGMILNFAANPECVSLIRQLLRSPLVNKSS